MAKYRNMSERVIVIGDKFFVPGIADGIELTKEEESNTIIKEYIDGSVLVTTLEVVALVEEKAKK